MEKIRLLSLFSGIGAFEKALKNIGISYELVGYSEIDKFASKSYSIIHHVPESMNLGDISKITDIPDCDLVTYGFPCQDISLLGWQHGIVEGETRSGLVFEALRIIKEKKPAYAICENVKNLVGKRFRADFDNLLDMLSSYGYNSYWQVLNAKDYGIPHNRERVFVVSIRKDIDDGTFKFPEPMPLIVSMSDLLETEPDKIFNLMMGTKKCFLRNSEKQKQAGNGFRFSPVTRDNAKIAKTILTKSGVRMDDNYINESDGVVLTKYSVLRKLTPVECFRLMGFDGTDAVKCSFAGISNTQLYKQAGNSIVVDVLQAIFKSLFKVSSR